MSQMLLPFAARLATLFLPCRRHLGPFQNGTLLDQLPKSFKGMSSPHALRDNLCRRAAKGWLSSRMRPRLNCELLLAVGGGIANGDLILTGDFGAIYVSRLSLNGVTASHGAFEKNILQQLRSTWPARLDRPNNPCDAKFKPPEYFRLTARVLSKKTKTPPRAGILTHLSSLSSESTHVPPLFCLMLATLSQLLSVDLSS